MTARDAIIAEFGEIKDYPSLLAKVAEMLRRIGRCL